jgi:hypothetical protein
MLLRDNMKWFKRNKQEIAKIKPEKSLMEIQTERMLKEGVVDPLTNKPVFKNEYEQKKFMENFKKCLELVKQQKG